MSSDKGPASNASPEILRYIAALHEIIGSGHGRMTTLLSPRVATEFAGIVSTETLRRLGFDKDADGGLASIKQLMQSLGMELAMTKVGEEFQCVLDCPFAKEIHPLLSQSAMCPAMLLVLGTVRSKQGSYLITKLSLNDQGAKAALSNPMGRE